MGDPIKPAVSVQSNSNAEMHERSWTLSGNFQYTAGRIKGDSGSGVGWQLSYDRFIPNQQTLALGLRSSAQAQNIFSNPVGALRMFLGPELHLELGHVAEGVMAFKFAPGMSYVSHLGDSVNIGFESALVYSIGFLNVSIGGGADLQELSKSNMCGGNMNDRQRPSWDACRHGPDKSSQSYFGTFGIGFGF